MIYLLLHGEGLLINMWVLSLIGGVYPPGLVTPRGGSLVPGRGRRGPAVRLFARSMQLSALGQVAQRCVLTSQPRRCRPPL